MISLAEEKTHKLTDELTSVIKIRPPVVKGQTDQKSMHIQIWRSTPGSWKLFPKSRFASLERLDEYPHRCGCLTIIFVIYCHLTKAPGIL
jgi:hypothetical protein